MSEHERTTQEPVPVGRDPDPQDEWLRALCAAADLPLDPSDALERQVAEMVAGHNGQAERRGTWWPLPSLRLGQCLAAAAAVAFLAALALGLRPWDRTRLEETPATSLVQQGSPEQSAPAPGSTGGPSRKSPVRTIARRQPEPPSAPRDGVQPSPAPSATDIRNATTGHSFRASRPHRSAVVDDAEYVNGDPGAVDRRWAHLSQDKWEQIEARVRQATQVRDDFVHIPFPRLALGDPAPSPSPTGRGESRRGLPSPRGGGAGGGVLAAAVESYQREAAIADTRLSRAVTLAVKGMALSDLCDQLRADTGIRLVTGGSVADEKVTVFCKQMPLREVMRQLSRPFGYAWTRSGKEGDYRYELEQDLRSQLLEEELRNRDRNEALLALDREMQRYRRYLNLSPDEALAAAARVPAEEKKLLKSFAGPGWGAIQIYFRLSPQQLDILRAGRSLTFSAEPREGSGDQPLPPDLARGSLQSQRQRRVYLLDGKYHMSNEREHPEGLLLTAIAEARGFVQVRIEQSELGTFRFTGGSGSFISPRSRIPGTWYLFSAGPELGVGMSPAVLDPKNGEVNAKLSRDPALQRRMALRPQASYRLAPEPEPIRAAASKASGIAPKAVSISEGEPEPRVTTADVLEALHQATGRPIIADYYTRLYPPAELAVQNLTLFDALNRLADRMRLRWNKEGEWLQFRSTSYFHDRAKEVPNRLLTRWADSRKQHGALTLDDLIEIAQLTDTQLDASGTAEGARAQYGLVEWALPRMENLRDQLRFLSEFTPDQRRQAQTLDGLPFSRMTLAQQRGYLARAFYDGQNPHLDDLGNAILNVDYRLPGWFRWSPAGQWHGFRPAPVRERTKEAALQAARRIDPGVDETQIVPTRLDLVFLYTANRQDDPRVDSTGPRGWFSRR